MKFKFAISLAAVLLAGASQAAVVGDLTARNPADARGTNDTFAALVSEHPVSSTQKNGLDSAAKPANESSIAMLEPDTAMLVAGLGVIGFLAARRRNR